jgi:SAM-dependent methyltransferase
MRHRNLQWCINMLSSNALYTDLSGYYDLMCCDINYLAQSQSVMRLHKLMGNADLTHLDLACGTAPHLQHFVGAGYLSQGLDIHQPMLDIARQRCPQAQFILHDMATFVLTQPVSLITCFLYSIHYNQTLGALKQCFNSVYNALSAGGMFCFNAVDKDKICNRSKVRHSTRHHDSLFDFESGWHYSGNGDQQALQLRIARTCAKTSEIWQDQHTMVAVSFIQLQALLAPWFDVHMLAHDYSSIQPWDKQAGNAIFACIKR